LTLKDDLDLSPLKICSSMRYICMPNIKFLSSIMQKLWSMLKFSDDANYDYAADERAMTIPRVFFENSRAKKQSSNFML